MRHHKFRAILLAAFMLLSGCGMNSAEILSQNMELGHAVLIFPVISDVGGTGIGLSRLDSDNPPGASDLPVITDVIPLGKKYAAMTVRPGTYHIRYLGSRTQAEGRELDGSKKFTSRFGEIRVSMTPSRRYRLERVWEPPEYEWIGGRRVCVWDGYWETRVRTDRLTSYLEALYDVARAAPENGPDLVGSVTAQAGDVLLLPGIRADIGLANGSCAFKGHEAPPDYAELAAQSGYTAYFNGSSDSRESLFHTSVYQCPVESISITLLQATTADLLEWVSEADLPPNTLERVKPGEFKPGRLFLEEHDSSPFSYTDSRVFSRDIPYSGTVHIFTGRMQGE
ncbi:hypothetical protein LJC48_03390 [Desulfovibrio sp. OttesenSCG-928-C06]|nr:hypothetical protein [Desulfovibrio sp. OttesenSCG-928-C06]